MLVVRFNASIVFWRLAFFPNVGPSRGMDPWHGYPKHALVSSYTQWRPWGGGGFFSAGTGRSRGIGMQLTSSQYYSGCFTLQEPVQRSFLVGFLLVGWEPKNVVFLQRKVGGETQFDGLKRIEKVVTKVTGVILWLVAWFLLGPVLVVVLFWGCCRSKVVLVYKSDNFTDKKRDAAVGHL